MPTLPKWLGDVVETAFSSKIHYVRVADVEYLHPKLKQVTFTGDFSSINFQVGYALAFRVTEREFRNYTPSFFDRRTGVCRVLFHLHGKGPGSNFAAELKIGDEVRLIEPRGKTFYQAEKSHHFFFGDETSLSIYRSLASVIDGNNQTYDGIIELSDLDTIPRQLGLNVKTVEKGTTPGQRTLELFNTLELENRIGWNEAVYYLTGNAKAIQLIVKELKQRGIKPRQIITQAFWATGKVGL
ncbi:siderophore-interacting protein [Desertivirga brevis]|uniref:siderophore-interacting protein n=1 Tax=Desertivirga brevis TaxID=2810310 RepID=UPI001A9729F1|nr:siderophore-interacting protein [Pedobacter sp. SYSU D00873]